MADDIVTRDVTDPWQEICDLRDEIERLRAAGDALVESLDHSRADIRSAVDAWEEARRG